MSGGRAAATQQAGNADDIVAQVAAASDNLQDLGLDDMQEPVDDDEEYVDEATGKKKQRSWLGKLGKGISKRAAAVKSAIAGAQMTQEDQDALAAVMACRHPYAAKEGGIGIQDPEEARLSRCEWVACLLSRAVLPRRRRGPGGRPSIRVREERGDVQGLPRPPLLADREERWTGPERGCCVKRACERVWCSRAGAVDMTGSLVRCGWCRQEHAVDDDQVNGPHSAAGPALCCVLRRDALAHGAPGPCARLRTCTRACAGTRAGGRITAGCQRGQDIVPLPVLRTKLN